MWLVTPGDFSTFIDLESYQYSLAFLIEYLKEVHDKKCFSGYILILYLHHVSLYGVLWLKVPHFHQFVW
jgi:hypothetical protein